MTASEVEELRMRTLVWARKTYEHLNRIWADAGNSNTSAELLREYEQIRDDALAIVMGDSHTSAESKS